MTNNMTRRTFTAMAAVGAASALLGGCSQKQDEQRREEAPVEKEPLAVAIKATGWNDKDVWSALSAVPLPRKWDEKTKEADGEDPFADHKEPYEWATCSGEESVAALGDENTEYLVRAYAPVLADGTIFKDSPRYVVVRAGSEPAAISFEQLEAKDMTDEAIASALAPFKADEKCLAALAAATAARMAAAKPAAPAEEAAPEAAPSAAQEATPQAAPSDGGGGSNAGGSGYEAPSGGSGGYTPPDSGDGGGVAREVGKVRREVDRACAECGDVGAHDFGRGVAFVYAGYGDIEPIGCKGLGNAEADAAAAAGDDGDGTCWCRHAARSLDLMWSATRSACAATDSAGFTAAEVGR